MGRIPTIAVIAIGLVLIIGLSAVMHFVVLKPQREELDAVQAQLKARQEVADRLGDATAKLEAVTAEWLEKQDQLQALRETRSIPISFAHPAGAMVALWYEYREDLPPLIEDWVESTGCTIESGASFPAPAMSPPSAPASGFLQVPDGQTITLAVSGDLTSLERLYRSLDQFPRVVTVSQLVMESDETGNILRAQVPFKFYLLVEAPAGAAPAAGGGGAAPMGAEGMMGPEGMMEPGMGPGMGPGMEPGAPGAPGAPGMPDAPPEA